MTSEVNISALSANLLLDRGRALLKERDASRARCDELLDTLRGVVRILDAVRYTQGLHGNQLVRLNKAKAIIAKAESAS